MTGLRTFQLIETSTPKLQRARDAMERQVRHMVRLVDDLLDVSRVTAGKIELRKDLVDVAAIIQQAVQTSQPQFQEKNHTLNLVLPREPIELLVDPARQAQIVSNLLSNAAKYTDVGGTISLRAARSATPSRSACRTTAAGSAGRCCRRCSACSCSPTAPSTWPRAGSASASPKLTSLSAADIKSVCEELAADFPERTVECGGGQTLTVGQSAADCANITTPPAACTATVGDARACIGGLAGATDAELCAGTFMLPAECAALESC